ncbi:Adenylate kinase isoenzyme 6 [Nosema bombycis CQ1]|uniref:Adenylate kinase isoenzyme 6 n=1 Tax=Nosema bombycis (strain CQ1 / CVCC 102059) TaxID=578461 RepID=R0MHT9_NOSB1|nr:Adenylate kinase isoenzyme 6 [Nosema bombycis CQ1]|eukprot:EOB13715.1 Adenylate kinase isoenzyme 6 [Nosema bombycis CQ1]
MKILITGTPGVGKTTLSKKISEISTIKHIDLSKFIKENQLYDSYDKEFDTHIFNEKTVKRELKKELDTLSSFIIDTHSPECVSFIDFDQIYILKVENSVLYSRLKERGYT